jgi:hypothetical protein
MLVQDGTARRGFMSWFMQELELEQEQEQEQAGGKV